MSCLAIFGSSFSEWKLTIVPLWFLELIDAALWFAEMLGPRARESLLQCFLHRDSLYICSPTITSLAFIQTKKAFGISV